MELQRVGSQQAVPQGIKIDMVGHPINYKVWANLVTFTFVKKIYFYKVRISCVDEEKADFTVNIEKDFNLRQKILSKFEVYGKLQEMFLGRYIYNDTLVKVIDVEPDKRFNGVYEHEGESYNLEMAIELQGERTDQRAILNYCRDILTIFQKNVIKFQRFGKMAYYDPHSRERVQGADHIDVVSGMELNMEVYKPATMKLNIEYKAACVFNQDVTYTLRVEFQHKQAVTYDELMAVLKDRKFTDTDAKLYLDDLTPKQETYTPVEVMNLSGIFYRTLRNLRFKRDPLTIRLNYTYFTCENKDIHQNEAVKKAVKMRQKKDFQFHQFCNETLHKIRTHWIFKENGIQFEESFNIINIERSLGAVIQLGGGEFVSTHQNDQYDRNYNNVYKNISHKVYDLRTSVLDRWTIVYEQVPGLKEKIQAMVEKCQRQLAGMYGIRINTPNVVAVSDIFKFGWNIQGNQLIVAALNSRGRKDALTRKYELVKFKCYEAGEIPNQVILSKTFEQNDFLKMVVLNLMYDFVMKLPNNVGQKLSLDDNVGKWLNGSTMVFAVDYEKSKGMKTVCSILHYLFPDFTAFKSQYLVKTEDAELKYGDESKAAFKKIIRDAILEFEETNRCVVNKIVVYRDGVTGMQKRHLENSEIAIFNEVIGELQREKLDLFFLTADKRVSTKIFEFNERENKIGHLEAGVYVDSNIVKDARPSFYLNSSNNRMSKCCYYEVMYPKEIANPNEFNYLMSFTFKLSFLYFHGYNIANIATPAILKYAQKKAYFYSIIHSLRDDHGTVMEDDALKRKRN